MKLVRLQRWMQDAVQTGATPARVDAVVLPSRALSAAERLGIYSGMYFSRLLEVLEQDFAAVRHATGAARFAALARAYLNAHPSTHPNLNQLGAHFAGDLLRRSRFLGELARLERTVQEVFDAARCPSLTEPDLAAVPPQRWAAMNLRLTPSTRLLASAYPVNAYYQAFREGRRPRRPRRRNEWILLWRKPDYGVWRRPLTRAQFSLLSRLDAGRPLAEALEAAVALDPELAGAIQPWFRQWSAEGIFQRPHA